MLHDLAPDIRFEPLPATAEGFEFSFDAKRLALGPHIAKRWGWDEAYQRAVHTDRLKNKPFTQISRNDLAIGTLSFAMQTDHIRFGEFYLLPEHQRRGIGTRILKHCIAQSDSMGLPMKLEYLKWNPVGALYRRHGFETIGQTDTHWLLARPLRGEN
ncbi:MAG: family N-acetyltransferase [Rhodospirillales bacterium]|jgi:GNAT superfamily N-acetyltransferase|nr:family N-acetyltransferase [Rhodospirillales bacterium]